MGFTIHNIKYIYIVGLISFHTANFLGLKIGYKLYRLRCNLTDLRERKRLAGTPN